MPQKVFVHGVPGLYGGAATELHHQIPVWQALGLEVHIVPTRPIARHEPLSLIPELEKRGCIVHDYNRFEAIEPKAPVLGFCSRDYLANLDRIRQHSTNTVFVNCMTWLFPEEKTRMVEGKIGTFLYQNDDVRAQSSAELSMLAPRVRAKYLTFVPHFDAHRFPFIDKRPTHHFGCGRISRQDEDKYSAHTLRIYEQFVSPIPKLGVFVGFDYRSAKKVGEPPDWIKTALDHRVCSQQTFYRHAEIVLQPTDTVENWPRVGLEAMASGSVLVVDNRGGWRRMVQHGKTGWLCNSERDFIFYASKMAYEPDVRREMASRARGQLDDLAGMQRSKESWKKVFEAIL